MSVQPSGTASSDDPHEGISGFSDLTRPCAPRRHPPPGRGGPPGLGRLGRAGDLRPARAGCQSVPVLALPPRRTTRRGASLPRTERLGHDHASSQQPSSPSGNSCTPTAKRSLAYRPRTVPSMTSSPLVSVSNEQTTSPGRERRRRHVHDMKRPSHLGPRRLLHYPREPGDVPGRRS